MAKRNNKGNNNNNNKNIKRKIPNMETNKLWGKNIEKKSSQVYIFLFVHP